MSTVAKFKLRIRSNIDSPPPSSASDSWTSLFGADYGIVEEDHPWLWRATVCCGGLGLLALAGCLFGGDSTADQKAVTLFVGLGLIVSCVAALAITRNWRVFGPLPLYKKAAALTAVVLGVVDIAVVVTIAVLVIAVLKAIGGAASDAVGGK